MAVVLKHAACLTLGTFVVAFLVTGSVIASTPKKTVHPKKSSVVASGRHIQAGTSGTRRVSTRKVIVTRKKVHGRWVRTTQVVSAPRGPSYQAHPDPERYQQIQQALLEKGYFKGEANGQWGEDSVAALKQFQTERQLPNDGKVTSLSLIGLGLGPNRETASTQGIEKPPGSN